MSIQQFLCPRIRLTKKDGGRLILPIDAISGIEENLREKCIRVCTMDGFWYDVVNQIVEVDKKIEEAIVRENGKVPIVLPDTNSVVNIIPETTITPHENTKAAKLKKKRMLSSGVDKPARLLAEEESEGAPEDSVATPKDKANAAVSKA